MPVVPMFHVNAWGIPLRRARWSGAKQVLPGRLPGPGRLARLIEQERVTLRRGVPTVWLGLLQALEQEPARPEPACNGSSCGGSAVPRAMMERYEQQYGVPSARLGHDRDVAARLVCWLKSYLEDVARGAERWRTRQRRVCRRRSSSCECVDEDRQRRSLGRRDASARCRCAGRG